jgi:hypothetical protein
MATFEANQVRACAIELNEKISVLYADILPLYIASQEWTLNGLDPALPDPYDVKIQLDAYQGLTIELLKLTDWVRLLQTAQVDDTLTYPTPPILSGQIQFDELSFEHIIF